MDFDIQEMFDGGGKIFRAIITMGQKMAELAANSPSVGSADIVARGQIKAIVAELQKTADFPPVTPNSCIGIDPVAAMDLAKQVVVFALDEERSNDQNVVATAFNLVVVAAQELGTRKEMYEFTLPRR